MKKVKRDDFDLASVKLVASGGIECAFVENSRAGESIFQCNHSISSPVIPHPTLVECIEKLKPFAMDVLALNQVEVIRDSKHLTATEKKGFTTVGKLLDKLNDDTAERVEVFGVHFKGKKAGIVVNTKFKTKNGQVVALNTPKIPVPKAEDDTTDMLEMIIDIEDEVYAYLFSGKKAQLDMFEGTEKMEAV